VPVRLGPQVQALPRRPAQALTREPAASGGLADQGARRVRRPCWAGIRPRRAAGSGCLYRRADPPRGAAVLTGPGRRAGGACRARRPGPFQPHGDRAYSRAEPDHDRHLEHVGSRRGDQDFPDPWPMGGGKQRPELADPLARLLGGPRRDLARRPGAGQGLGEDLSELAGPGIGDHGPDRPGPIAGGGPRRERRLARWPGRARCGRPVRPVRDAALGWRAALVVGRRRLRDGHQPDRHRVGQRPARAAVRRSVTRIRQRPGWCAQLAAASRHGTTSLASRCAVSARPSGGCPRRAGPRGRAAACRARAGRPVPAHAGAARPVPGRNDDGVTAACAARTSARRRRA